MSDTTVQLISWAFIAANSGRILAYLPQFVAVYRCTKGAKAVSVLTWAYFALAHLTGFLYAVYVAHDTRMAWVFTGNFAACATLVMLVCWRRWGHLLSQSPTRHAERLERLAGVVASDA